MDYMTLWGVDVKRDVVKKPSECSECDCYNDYCGGTKYVTKRAVVKIAAIDPQSALDAMWKKMGWNDEIEVDTVRDLGQAAYMVYIGAPTLFDLNADFSAINYVHM